MHGMGDSRGLLKGDVVEMHDSIPGDNKNVLQKPLITICNLCRVLETRKAVNSKPLSNDALYTDLSSTVYDLHV